MHRSRIVGLAVGGDLLDVYRRGKLIEGKVARIDDADAVESAEPYFSIRGLGDVRGVAAGERMAPYAVGAVENGGLDRPLASCRSLRRPRLQLGARNAHQAAGHVQPERMGVVFHRPMNRIAGQSVLAGQRRDAAVFQPAEPAFGGGPERTVRIEPKSLTRPRRVRRRRCRMRGPGRPEIRDAALRKSEPEAALRRIGG